MTIWRMVRHLVLCLTEPWVVNSSCVVQDGKGDIEVIKE